MHEGNAMEDKLQTTQENCTGDRDVDIFHYILKEGIKLWRLNGNPLMTDFVNKCDTKT